MPPSSNRQSSIENRQSIGIAVVEHHGRYLVGIRDDVGPLAGYAEFPGGKCGSGESPRDCALRECREETGLEVVPIKRLVRRAFDYPHGPVDLHFWLCRPAGSPAAAADIRGFRWIDAAELTTLKFPEANDRVVALLTTGEC